MMTRSRLDIRQRSIGALADLCKAARSPESQEGGDPFFLDHTRGRLCALRTGKYSGKPGAIVYIHPLLRR
jgi:hypothetical protein